MKFMKFQYYPVKKISKFFTCCISFWFITLFGLIMLMMLFLYCYWSLLVFVSCIYSPPWKIFMHIIFFFFFVIMFIGCTLLYFLIFSLIFPSLLVRIDVYLPFPLEQNTACEFSNFAIVTCVTSLPPSRLSSQSLHLHIRECEAVLTSLFSSFRLVLRKTVREKGIHIKQKFVSALFAVHGIENVVQCVFIIVLSFSFCECIFRL